MKRFDCSNAKRFAVAMAILAMAAASAWAAPSQSIQERIDAAESGDVVRLEPGVYRETLVVKDGVTLAGAGADATIVDGTDAEVAVRMGKEAALVGLTVRGGKTGVANDKSFVGIFDCNIVGAGVCGVRLNSGSGAIVNTYVGGTGVGTGVMSLGANPVVRDCQIAAWTNGVMAWHKYEPVLEGNIVRDCQSGVVAGKGTPVVLSDNIFWNNEVADVKGCDYAPASAPDEPDAAQTARPYADFGVEDYLDLMGAVYVQQVALHPIVTYQLPESPQALGRFDVYTAFDWSEFTVSAATADTEIRGPEATDTYRNDPLPTELKKVGELPSVAVQGALDEARDMGRFVMHGTYVHAPSYGKDDKGDLVFRRTTSFSHIRVVAPAGCEILSAEPDGAIERRPDGRYEARITDVGLTEVTVRMRRVAGD